MFKRLAYGALLAAMGLVATGCCTTHYGMYDAGFGCGDCGIAACDTCGDCQPGLRRVGRPLASAMACDAGCGDVYWGEWASDPPCDSCGGGCYGIWNPLRGLAHLWGYRYAPSGYGMGYDVGFDGAYDGGCQSCRESYDSVLPSGDAGDIYDEELPAPKPDIQPEPAKQASAKRPARSVKHVPASYRTPAPRRR